MKHLLFISILSFVTSAFSAELKSAKALTTVIEGREYIARLEPGHHFNDKAPNQLTVDGREVKPSDFASRRLKFALPKSYGSAKAALYVCDDAITYCEIHQVDLPGGKGAVKTPAKTAAVSKKVARPNRLGFIEDDLAAALHVAKEQKKLVLVDFAAHWCPGCLRYETETFPGKAFRNLTKGYVKVRIDVDHFENFFLTEKYKIRGIPAVLALTADGDEISRVVDYQPTPKLEEFFGEIDKDPRSMTELAKTQEGDSDVALRLGRRLLAAGQVTESLPWLSKVKPEPSELWSARLQAAHEKFQTDEKTNKAMYARTLREALAAEPKTTRSLAWRTELLPLVDAKSKEFAKTVEEGTQLADQLLEDDVALAEAVKTDAIGEFTGQEKFLVAILRADLIEASGAPEADVKAGWARAADVAEANQVDKLGDGPALRMLIILNGAERFEKALALADRMLKAEPNSFELRRRKLRVLLGLKRYPEAIALGEKILPQAEGRNQFWVAESLSKAYIGAKRPEEAKRILTASLARDEMAMERMKSSKKSFEDLLKSIDAPAETTTK